MTKQISSEEGFWVTWLFSDRVRIEEGFVAGIKIPGTYQHSAIPQWLNDQEIRWKVSYCGISPPYHTYWFRSESDANLFSSAWKGNQAKPGEGFTGRICDCAECRNDPRY